MLKAYTNFTEAKNFAEDIVNFSTEVAQVKLFMYIPYLHRFIYNIFKRV